VALGRLLSVNVSTLSRPGASKRSFVPGIGEARGGLEPTAGVLLSDTGSHGGALSANARASTKAGVDPLLTSDVLLAKGRERLLPLREQ
jgi:hypothetical protein